MAKIEENFGEGGRQQSKGHGLPSLAEALRDISDDLDALKSAEIASPDAIDDASAHLLVNEIKAALNAVFNAAKLTSKG